MLLDSISYDDFIVIAVKFHCHVKLLKQTLNLIERKHIKDTAISDGTGSSDFFLNLA